MQGLTVNGASHDKTYLPHDQLADGATLTFDMGPQPSRGRPAQARRRRRSPTTTMCRGRCATRPAAAAMATRAAARTPAALFDDTLRHAGDADGAQPWVQYRFAGRAQHRCASTR